MKNDYSIDIGDCFSDNELTPFFRELLKMIAKGKRPISLNFSEKSAIVFARECYRNILEDMANRTSETKNEYDELLTKKEVANLLGICTTTLWNWKKKGYLIPVQIGHKKLYRLSDIEKLRKGEQ